MLYDKVDEVKSMIRDFKSTSWSKFIGRFKGGRTSSKPFWNRINRMKQKKQPKSIPNINHNGIILTNNIDKANAFGEKLSKTFNTSEDTDDFNENHKQFVNKAVTDYLNKNICSSLEPFNLNELNTAIEKLNNKSNLDDNLICNKMLKKLPNNFKILVLSFFNQSINEGIIPDICKLSTITMIPKKGDKSILKNYRPINSTLSLYKLLEKLVLHRINEFLLLNNTIIRQQSGFRNNRLTKDNLIFMIQKILETFGNRKKACCIFFDIQAAFDKIWHDGLIY